MTVSGDHKALKDYETFTCHRQERKRGQFKRSIVLPVSIDESKIICKFENGILDLTLPKTEKIAKRVAIQ